MARVWGPWTLIFLVALNVNCTRKTEVGSLRLSFPRSKSLGALSVSGYLKVAVINIQLPSGPLIYKFEYHDNSVGAGQALTFEIPGVPLGAHLVQFLGVYQAEAQAKVITYDDAVAEIRSGNNTVSLTAVEVGSFSKESRLIGRYLDTPGPPETGPTGTLVMQYQPPAGAPKMSILKFPIVDGWFQVIGLDGTPLSYVIEESGQSVFSDIQWTGSAWSVGGSALSFGNHLARFSMPAHYKRSDSSSTQDRPPMDLLFGYFQKPGLNLLGDKKVCVANDINEGSRYFSDSATANRIDIDLSSIDASKIHRISGGVTAIQSEVYTDTAAACSVASEEKKILVYHTLLNDEGFLGGIAAPFMAEKPFVAWDHFIATSFAYVPSNRITVKWKFLPGIASVDGVAVMAKEYTSANSAWSHMDTCDEVSKNGFAEVGTATFPASEFVFASSSITSANRNSWGFLLCPYKNSGGQRRWVGQYVGGGGLKDGSSFSTGWAPAGQTYTGSGAETFFARGAKLSQVLSVDTSSSDKYTLLEVSDLAAWSTPAAGSEVGIAIVGRGSLGGCGTHNGEILDVGETTFARVLWAAAGSPQLIKIPKGTFVDSLEGQTLNGSTTGSNHCQVTISHVLQYRDLNLASTTSFTTGHTEFNFGNEAAPVTLRVNGLLTLGNTSISANGVGYKGGSTGYLNGAGIRRASDSSGSSGSGGTQATAPSDGAGGGGGLGSGSNGTLAGSGGSGHVGVANTIRLIMGGGGGGGYSGEPGGHGGGSILISAKNIHLVGNASISADGTNGTSGGGSGGGGGGGSVTLLVKSITRSASETLTLTANGGAGGAAAGGGSGGSAIGSICSSALPSGDLISSASLGANGSAGQAGYAQFSVVSSNPLCSLE